MTTLYAQSNEFRLSKKQSNHALLLQRINQTKNDISTLTPAGRRMLLTLHSLLEQNEFNPVDREQIASGLGRPGGLTAWDRQLLKRLEDMHFITCQKHALSTYQDQHKNTLGRGYKLVYAMPIDFAWRLAQLLRSTRKKRNDKE